VEAAGGQHLQLGPGFITQFVSYSECISETHPVSKMQDEMEEEFLIGIIGCEEGRAPHDVILERLPRTSTNVAGRTQHNLARITQAY